MWTEPAGSAQCLGGIMRTGLFGAAASLLLASTVPLFAADGLSLSAGMDSSSGKYGATQATNILVMLTDLSFQTGDFRFSAALPYLNVEGPAYFVIGSGGVPVVVNPRAGSNKTSRVGIGDLGLSATYSVPSDSIGGFDLDLTGRVILPTAGTSKGLSTGKTDFGFSADLSREMDIWTPFVTLGYRIPGEPTGYSLKSSPSVSIGTSVQTSEETLAIISYDYDAASSSSIADSHEVFGSLSWLCSDALTLTGYGEFGFSSGAPASGGGLLVTWKVP